jgi:hypothetical protein
MRKYSVFFFMTFKMVFYFTKIQIFTIFVVQKQRKMKKNERPAMTRVRLFCPSLRVKRSKPEYI